MYNYWKYNEAMYNEPAGPRLYQKVLSASASTVTAIGRGCERALLGMATSTGKAVRHVGRTLTGAASVVGGFTWSRRFVKELFAHVTVTGSIADIVRIVVKMLQTTVNATITAIPRGLTIIKATVVNATGGIARQASRGLVTTVDVTSSKTISATKSLLANAVVTSAIVRGIKRTLKTTVSVIGTHTWAKLIPIRPLYLRGRLDTELSLYGAIEQSMELFGELEKEIEFDGFVGE